MRFTGRPYLSIDPEFCALDHVREISCIVKNVAIDWVRKPFDQRNESYDKTLLYVTVVYFTFYPRNRLYRLEGQPTLKHGGSNDRI